MLSVGSVQAQFGRVTQVLRQSADQGQTWSQGITVRQPPTDISHLQGWRGTLPTRLYLVAAGSELYRSDDDAATWTLVATFTREDGTADWRSAIGALTYDPARPDHVYIAVGGGVRASADSGSNWGPLGRQDLPRINDLALGVDGRYLYAATEAGLYRLPLAQRQREAPASVPAAR